MQSLELFKAPFAFMSSESYSASLATPGSSEALDLDKWRAVRGDPNTDLKIRMVSMAQRRKCFGTYASSMLAFQPYMMFTEICHNHPLVS